MKFSSLLLSLSTLGATGVLAFPLANGARDLQPVRRSEAPTATPSATETSAASSTTTTASATSSTADPTETATYLYSTITNTDESAPRPTTRTETASSTSTVSTSTETQAPQETESVSDSRSFDNSRDSRNRNNGAIVVRVRETVVIREQIIVERPVFVAVQLNVRVQQITIVNHITNVFQSRFDNWDINVVNQLALIIAQQFGVVSRASNRGFDQINNRQFNSFVERFVQQFSVFQQIRLVDVQQFITVVQRFDINQLASFFGRSQLLFSQSTFQQFNINKDFGIFVQQLSNMLVLIQNGAFDSDGIFNLNGVTLIDGGLNLGRSTLQV